MDKDRESLENLNSVYQTIKEDIIKRLEFFRSIRDKNDENLIFEELLFCILTPQSKARMADKAITNLKNKNLLFSDDVKLISDELNVVRFKNNKAKYIIEAKKLFTQNGKISIIDKIDSNDIFKTRDWFVNNIKGYGYKEGSHFLRNIGLGMDLAILDRHILKNLKNFSVIQDIPQSIGRKKYFEIEEKIKKFSEKVEIPLDHLDFVLWFKEAGEIFK